MIIVFIFIISLFLGISILPNIILRRKVNKILERKIPKFLKYNINTIEDFTNRYVIRGKMEFNDDMTKDWINNELYLHFMKSGRNLRERSKLGFYESYDIVITLDPLHNIMSDNIDSGIDYLTSEVSPEFKKTHKRDQKLKDLGIF